MFPAQIRSKLEKLTDGIPELVFFKLMTPRYDQQECPSPETYGGWQATVFRTVALAAGLGCSHENSIFDLGEEGDNGKEVLAAATRETFDGYYEELPLATVTKDPPSGNETSPQVYKLQGAPLDRAQLYKLHLKFRKSEGELDLHRRRRTAVSLGAPGPCLRSTGPNSLEGTLRPSLNDTAASTRRQ